MTRGMYDKWNTCPLRCQYVVETCFSLPWNRHYKLCWEQSEWVSYEFEPDNPKDDPRDLVPAHRTIVRKSLCDLHYQVSGQGEKKHYEKWDAETFYLGRKSNWQTIIERPQGETKP